MSEHTENTPVKVTETTNELQGEEDLQYVMNTRQTGRVKWFNNRAGYGFVTLTRGKACGRDIFAHHSGIKVGSEQYKYLVQGEYVEFDSCKSNNDKHPLQACNICGVDNGKLMCETRNENRQNRNPEYNRNNVRPHGGGPRSDGQQGDGQYGGGQHDGGQRGGGQRGGGQRGGGQRGGSAPGEWVLATKKGKKVNEDLN
jgi:cold shock CspA family protein